MSYYLLYVYSFESINSATGHNMSFILNIFGKPCMLKSFTRFKFPSKTPPSATRGAILHFSFILCFLYILKSLSCYKKYKDFYSNVIVR